mmetsp:Transcript_22705/g.31981  ORF Transcript_22705/g.31981 Transcript_22705/m.31981 type:complete len:235 (+) Transcript_22705:96-800(+)
MVEHRNSSKQGSFKTHVEEEWACPQCTLLNPLTANVCNACMMQRPRMIAASAPAVSSLEEEPEIVIGRDYETKEDPKESSNLIVMVPEPLEDDNEDGGLREPLIHKTDVVHIEPPVSTTTTPSQRVVLGDEEDPIKKKRRRRRRRRVRMVLGGVGGLVVGAIVFPGPGGPIFGVVAGAVSARQISKRRERKKDEMLARAAAMSNATESKEENKETKNSKDPSTCELERSDAVLT